MAWCCQTSEGCHGPLPSGGTLSADVVARSQLLARALSVPATANLLHGCHAFGSAPAAGSAPIAMEFTIAKSTIRPDTL